MKARTKPFQSFTVLCSVLLHSMIVAFYFFIQCFPDNKTGLILIFTPTFALGLIFGGWRILIYRQMKLQSKCKRFLNKQKLRKIFSIYLSLACYLLRNSLRTIYSKTIISSSSRTGLLKRFCSVTPL